MRLVRYLAQCGVASRRASGGIVQSGAVAVNGQITTNVAHQVEDGDQVTVNGRLVALAQTAYLMLHKPAGVVSSRSDPHNPETVLDCVPAELRNRVKPVGRLDKDATGLLLLTDDGALAHRLTHPRYGVDKTYVARVRGQIAPAIVDRLEKGVVLEDGKTAPARVRIVGKTRQFTTLEITIHEGRNRQVKRMCQAVGHRVESLHRIQFGPLPLDPALPAGTTRPLTPAELAALRNTVEK